MAYILIIARFTAPDKSQLLLSDKGRFIYRIILVNIHLLLKTQKVFIFWLVLFYSLHHTCQQHSISYLKENQANCQVTIFVILMSGLPSFAQWPIGLVWTPIDLVWTPIDLTPMDHSPVTHWPGQAHTDTGCQMLCKSYWDGQTKLWYAKSIGHPQANDPLTRWRLHGTSLIL